MCVTNNKEEKMTNINPIKFGVTGSYLPKKEEKQDLVKNSEKTNVQPQAKKSVDSNEVLGFLAAQNADLVPAKTKKTVDVSKYVTPEQAERISGFIKGFEKDYDEISEAAVKEFPDLTESAAGSIALAYINASY